MQRSPYIKLSKTEKKSFDKSNTEVDFFSLSHIKRKKKLKLYSSCLKVKKAIRCNSQIQRSFQFQVKLTAGKTEQTNYDVNPQWMMQKQYAM